MTDNSNAHPPEEVTGAVRVPSEETIAAMREAREVKLPRFANTKDLLRELNEGD